MLWLCRRCIAYLRRMMSGDAPTNQLRSRLPESWFGRLLFAPALMLAGVLALSAAQLVGRSPADEPIGDPSPEVIGLRLTWGGPVPHNYSGRLSIEGGRIERLEPLGLLPTSGYQLARDGDQAVRIGLAGAAQFGGADVWIRGTDATRLELRLSTGSPGGTADSEESSLPIGWTLAQLRGGSARHRLDDVGNQVVLERTPDDRLRLATSPHGSVYDPGESISVQVSGHRTGLSSGRASLEMELVQLPQQLRVERRSWNLTIDSDGNFTPVPLLITTPTQPGVYQVNWRLNSHRGMTQLLSGGESIHRSWQWVVAPRTVGRVATIDRPARMSWEPSRMRLPTPATGLASVPRDWLPWPMPWLPDWGGLGGRLPTVYAGPWRGDCEPPVQEVWIIPPGQSEQRSLGSLEPGQLQRLTLEIDSQSTGEWSLVLFHDRLDETSQTPLLVQRLQLSPLACYGERQSYRHHLCWYSDGGSYRAVVSNLSESQPLAIHQLQVEQAGSPSLADLRPRPTVSPTAEVEDFPPRLVSLYQNTPLLAKTFGAPEALDPVHQQPLEDWTTFWTASQRLVQHAQRGGYNCLTLSVAADGAALYPTRVLPNTGRFDGGRFFSDGRDLVGKDVVELILRLAGLSGLKVVLAVNLNVPLESLPVATVGAPGGRNPLAPAVQGQLEQMIDELVERYSEHPAWAGVALVMSADTQLLFGNAESGWETDLLAQFATDQQLTDHIAPIARVPGEVASWFAEPSRRLAWLTWRARRLAAQHHRLAQRLRRHRSDLVVQLLLDNRSVEAGSAAAWLERGLDQSAYRGSDSVVCLSFRDNHAQWPDTLEGEDWVVLGGEGRPWQGRREGTPRQQTVSSGRQELSSGRTAEPSSSAQAWRGMTAPRRAAKSGIGEPLRRAWLQMLNQQLPTYWLDDLNLPPGGDPELTADIRQLLGYLPAIEMRSIPIGIDSGTGRGSGTERKRPLTSVGVQAGSHAHASYLLLINTAPWAESLTLQLQAAAGEPAAVEWLSDIGAASEQPTPPAQPTQPGWQSWVRTAGYRTTHESAGATPPRGDPLPSLLPHQVQGDATWEITLPGYSLQLARIAAADVRVVGWQSAAEPEHRLRVRQQQDEFQRTLQQLAGQPRRFTDPPNAAFMRWTREGHPLDWTPALAPQAEIRPGIGFDNRPATAVHLIHRGGAGTCWIQSGPFPPPTTRRLAVAIRMAAADPSQALAPVQISLEVRDAAGQRHWLRQTYTEATNAVGNERRERDTKAPENRWREPIFRFQLPVMQQPIVALRLGIDLQSEGEVLIDRVELFDRFLSPEQRRHWQNQLFLTNRDLEEGILESTLRLQERWAAREPVEPGQPPAASDPTAAR